MRSRWRWIRVALATCILGAVVPLSACSQQLRDLEDVPAQDPGPTSIYVQPDLFPNIVKTCIEGTAWVTTTRDYDALTRAPELDKTC